MVKSRKGVNGKMQFQNHPVLLLLLLLSTQRTRSLFRNIVDISQTSITLDQMSHIKMFV